MIRSGKFFIKKYVKNGKILPNNIDKIKDDLRLNDLNIRVIENLPKIVSGDFSMTNNKIEKIENIPEEINGYISFNYNKIEKIENIPEGITALYLNHNKISKIENIPYSITNYLHLIDNKIQTIENIDNEFIYDIDLSRNPITEYKEIICKFDQLKFNKDIFYGRRFYNEFRIKYTKERNLKRLNGLLK